MHKQLVLASAALAFASVLTAQDCANLGTNYGVGDDVLVNAGGAIPIGFAFPFAGGTYTDLHPSTNGFVYLSNGGVPAPGAGDGTATAAELVAGSPRICALWTDLNMLAANDGAVWVGSSPAECRVTWKNAQNFGIAGNVFTIQMVLRPTGDVQFFYETGATNNSSFGVTFAAGLVGCSPGGGATLPAVSDLSAGGASTSTTLFEDFLVASTFDMANNSLLLVPNASGWTYLTTGTGWIDNCATASSYGTGCGPTNPVGEAKYELFTAASPLDLSNTGHTYIWTGNGYLLLDGAGPIVPAVGAPTPFSDDQTRPIALGFNMPTAGGNTSNIWLCSNGWLAFQATTSTDLSESIADHLAGVAKLAFLWDDLNPAAGGSITIDQVSGTECIVTFDAVREFAVAASANTVQVVLSVTGTIEVRYGACSIADGLVGISPGSNAIDGGSVDYSALATSGPVAINTGAAPFGSVPLTLTSNLPLLGAAWTLTTTNVDPISPGAITAIGLTPIDPGIDLAGIGAPGCNLHITPVLLDVFVPSVNGTAVLNVPVPTTTSTIGFALTAQSACLSPINALQIATSNGVRVTVGP